MESLGNEAVTNDVSEDSKNENTIYPGASVSLPIFQDEYSKELERKNILENKVISLITIEVAMLTIFIPIIPFEEIGSKLLCDVNKAVIAVTVACMILAVSIVVAVISMIFLLSSIAIQTYKKIDIDRLDLDCNMIQSSNAVERGLCTHYKNITLENASLNEKKAQKYKIALPLTMIAFGCLLIGTILIKIV